MDNKKNDCYYFSKIVENIATIKKYFNNATYEEFLSDEKTMDSIMFRFVQLIENIKSISKEFKLLHSEIDWDDIVGFRNRLVHEYGKTDYVIVYSTIVSDLDKLKVFFEQFLQK